MAIEKSSYKNSIYLQTHTNTLWSPECLKIKKLIDKVKAVVEEYKHAGRSFAFLDGEWEDLDEEWKKCLGQQSDEKRGPEEESLMAWYNKQKESVGQPENEIKSDVVNADLEGK